MKYVISFLLSLDHTSLARIKLAPICAVIPLFENTLVYLIGLHVRKTILGFACPLPVEVWRESFHFVFVALCPDRLQVAVSTCPTDAVSVIT